MKITMGHLPFIAFEYNEDADQINIWGDPELLTDELKVKLGIGMRNMIMSWTPDEPQVSETETAVGQYGDVVKLDPTPGMDDAWRAECKMTHSHETGYWYGEFTHNIDTANKDLIRHRVEAHTVTIPRDKPKLAEVFNVSPGQYQVTCTGAGHDRWVSEYANEKDAEAIAEIHNSLSHNPDFTNGTIKVKNGDTTSCAHCARQIIYKQGGWYHKAHVEKIRLGDNMTPARQCPPPAAGEVASPV